MITVVGRADSATSNLHQLRVQLLGLELATRVDPSTRAFRPRHDREAPRACQFNQYLISNLFSLRRLRLLVIPNTPHQHQQRHHRTITSTRKRERQIASSQREFPLSSGI